MVALLARAALILTSMLSAPTNANAETGFEICGDQAIDTRVLADEPGLEALPHQRARPESASSQGKTDAAPPMVVIQEEVGLRRDYLYDRDGVMVGEEVLDTFRENSLLRGVYFKFDGDRLSGVVIEDVVTRELGISYGDAVTLSWEGELHHVKPETPTLVLIEDHNGVGPIALIWNGRWLFAETTTFIETGALGVEDDRYFEELLYLRTEADLTLDPDRYILTGPREDEETQPGRGDAGGTVGHPRHKPRILPGPHGGSPFDHDCPSDYSICGADLRTDSCFTWGTPPNYLTWEWLLWDYRGVMGGTRFWNRIGGTGCGPGDSNQTVCTNSVSQTMEFKAGAGLDGLEWSTSVTEDTSYSFSVTLQCDCCEWERDDGKRMQSCLCGDWQAVWRVTLTWWSKKPGQGWLFGVPVTRYFRANNIVPVKCCDDCGCPL